MHFQKKNFELGRVFSLKTNHFGFFQPFSSLKSANSPHTSTLPRKRLRMWRLAAILDHSGRRFNHGTGGRIQIRLFGQWMNCSRVWGNQSNYHLIQIISFVSFSVRSRWMLESIFSLWTHSNMFTFGNKVSSSL